MLTTYLMTFAAVAVAPTMFELIDRAARRANTSHKALASDQGKTPAQWSRELHTGRVRLDLLLRCERAFFVALLDELRDAVGGEKPITAREVLDVIRPLVERGSEAQRCA